MLTFSEPFYSWCIYLALQIAKRRGDATLKPQEMLRRHFEHELFVELPKATFPEDEIPDVLYYGACLVKRGCSDVLPLIEDTLQRYGYSQEQAEAMTIAKYLLRGAGLPKAVEIERFFIRMAIADVPAFWQSVSALSVRIRDNSLSCPPNAVRPSNKFHIWNLLKTIRKPLPTHHVLFIGRKDQNYRITWHDLRMIGSVLVGVVCAPRPSDSAPIVQASPAWLPAKHSALAHSLSKPVE